MREQPDTPKQKGVMTVDKKECGYDNLQNLLFNCAGARQYFSSLPGYAQEMVTDRSDAICTEEDLHNYADNLLRGDH